MTSGLFLLYLAIGFAGAKIEEKAFRPQREYVYLYQTQVTSGLPGLSSVYSAIKIKALVRAQFVTASRVKAKLENVVLLKFNEETERMNPTNRIIPSRTMAPVVGPELTTIVQELIKPITFDYISGHVTNFETASTDPHWSVNVKRGLVALFEVNLEQRFSMETNRSSSTANFATGVTYTCMDPTPSGLTETVYTVIPEDRIPNAYNVIKVRNYTNAIDHPSWYKNTVEGHSCFACEEEREERMTVASQVRYAIVGDKTKFLISSAVAESKYTLFGISGPEGQIQMSTNQTITLLNAMDISATRPIPAIPSPIKRSLTTFVPEMAIAPIHPFSNETRAPISRAGHATYSKATVVAVLKAAAEYMGDTLTPEAMRFITQCIDALRNTEPVVIEEIIKTYMTPTKPTDQTAKNIRAVLLKVLPVVGTAPVARILIQNIALLPPAKSPYIIGALVVSVEPNVHVMKMLMELARTTATSSPKLRRATVLAIGALTWKLQITTNKYMKQLRHEINTTRIMLSMENSKVVQTELSTLKQSLEERLTQTATLSNTLIQGVVSLLRGILQKGVMDEKILALKAIGNAGCMPMIEDIKTIITNPTMPALVRAQAAFALRRMAMYKREQVVMMLMPVITNRNEESVVRLACFDALIMGRPDATVWQTIASTLAYEPDLQFSSYVASVMRTVSNSSNPCMRAMAKNVAHALTMAIPPRAGMTYSRLYTKEKFYVARGAPQFGGAISLAYYGSNSSIVPQAASAKLSGYMMGRTANFFEIGYNTQGLQAIFDKWFGPKGILTSRKSLFDVLSRARRSSGASPQAQIENLFQKIGVVARRELAPAGHAYYKFNDHELMYYPLTETMKQIVSTGKVATGFVAGYLNAAKTVDIRRAYIMADAQYTIATSMGLPLRLRLTAANGLIVRGSINAKVSPALFESDRKGKAPVEAEVTANLHVSNAMEFFLSMQIGEFVMHSGVAVRATKHANMPVTATVRADLTKQKIFATITPPVSATPIMKVKIVPLTWLQFTSASPNPVMFKREEKEIGVTHNARVVPFMKNITRGTFGFRSAVNGQYPIVSTAYPAIPCPLFGRSEVYLWSTPTPTATAAKPVEIQVALVSEPKNVLKTPHSSSCNSILSFFSACSWVDGDMPGDQETAGPASAAANSSATLPLPDFADLKTTGVSVGQLKIKLQQKIRDNTSLSAVGSKWGMVCVVKSADSSIPAKLQAEALWISSQKGYVQQFAARVARTAAPNTNKPAMEITVHSEVKYPTKFVLPETLFEPSYRAALAQNLKFLLSLKTHHGLLTSLNSTVITQSLRDSMRIDMDPVKTIERIVINMAAESKAPELRKWLPILRQLGANYEFLTATAQKVLDPFNFFTNEGVIVVVFEKIESLVQAVRTQMQRIKSAKSANPVELTLVHYVMLKQKQALNTLVSVGKMGSYIADFNKGQHLLAKAQSVWAMYKTELIELCSLVSQGGLSPLTDTSSPVAAEIMKLRTEQAATLKTILSQESAATTVNPAPVKPLLHSTFALLKTLTTTDSSVSNIPAIAALVQIAIQHQLVKLTLTNPLKYIESANSPMSAQLTSELYANVYTADAQTRLICVKTGSLLIRFSNSKYLTPTMDSVDKTVWRIIGKGYERHFAARVALANAKFSSPSTYVPSNVLALMRPIMADLGAIKSAYKTSMAPPSVPVVVDCLRFTIIQKAILAKLKMALLTVPGQRSAVQEVSGMLSTLSDYNYFLTKLLGRYATSATVDYSNHVLLSDMPMRSVDLKLRELLQEVQAIKQEVMAVASAPVDQARQMATMLASKLQTVISECRSVLTSGALWSGEAPARHSPEMFSSLISQLSTILEEVRSDVASYSSPLPPDCVNAVSEGIKEVRELRQQYQTEANNHPTIVSSSMQPVNIVSKLEELTATVSSINAMIKSIPTVSKSDISSTCSQLTQKCQAVVTELTSILNAGSLSNSPAVWPHVKPMFAALITNFKNALIEAQSLSGQMSPSPPPAMNTKIASFLAATETIDSRFEDEAQKHQILKSSAESSVNIIPKLSHLTETVSSIERMIKSIPAAPRPSISRKCSQLTQKCETVIAEMTAILNAGSLWVTPAIIPHAKSMFSTCISKFQNALTEAQTLSRKMSPPPSVNAKIASFVTSVTQLFTRFETEANNHHMLKASLIASSSIIPTLSQLTDTVTSINTMIKSIPTVSKSNIASTCSQLTQKCQTVITELTSILNAGSLWGSTAVTSHAESMFTALITNFKNALIEAQSLSAQMSPTPPPAVNTKIASFLTSVTELYSRYEVEVPKHRSTHISPLAVAVHGASAYPMGIVGFINVAYGTTTASPVLSIKIYGSKSVEQILSEIKQINPFQRDPALQRVLMQTAGVTEFTEDAQRYRIQLNEYRHVHFLATSPNPAAISPGVKKLAIIFKNALIGRFYPSLSSMVTPRNTVPANTVSALMIFNNANKRVLDCFLTTPHEAVSFTGLKTPTIVQALIPVSIRSTPILTAGYLTSWHLPGRCIWSGPLVRTFDHSYVAVPKIGTCPVVVAMDCSPAKSFAIVAKPTVPTTALPRAVVNVSKVIEIYAENHFIELVPNVGQMPTVKVNGAVTPVEVGTPVIIEKTLSYNRPAAIIKIMKVYYGGQYFMKVEMPVLGVAVLTDCYFLSVTPSMMYRAKTCGLCSNFDGEISKELVGPTGQVFNSHDPFVRSYVFSNGTCQAPASHPDVVTPVENNLKAPVHSASCVPVSKTVIKSRSKGKRACFSIKPVTMCSSACNSSQKERISVPFHCTDATSAEANDWMKASESRVVHEVSEKPVTFSISLKNEVKCALK
ncbi:uncharacterized protein LOC126819202 [Patella vulgata]|uniref:uncharacterized protein LOC126819202 n=1 Tax=Patella vulgata TaxID=6465 RepID=UPI0021800921|nr:uncharacterized protein LOC126819202 [Patella vulgata]